MATIKMKGFDEVNQKMALLSKHLPDEVQNAIDATAIDVRNTAVKKVQAAGSGNTYTQIFATIGGKIVPMGPRSGNNLSASHTASKPGEAPATDTGAGANSIFTKFGDLQSWVYTRLKYMMYLEFGTRTIAPRPWLMPSADENLDGYKKRLYKVVEKVRRKL